jgi:lysophosphatidate acyltransferase
MTLLMNILKFYLSVPLVMLSSSLVGYLSPVPTLRFWSRAVTCYCSMLLCASYGVIASILLRIAGRPTLAQWATGRSFALSNSLIGWEWDIQGEEILSQSRPAVFISNHQRYVGIMNGELTG